MSKQNKQQQKRKQKKQQRRANRQQREQKHQQNRQKYGLSTKQPIRVVVGTKAERAAHFAAVDKARKAASALVTGDARAVKKQFEPIRKVVEAAGGAGVLTKPQRAAYEAAGVTVEKHSAAARKGAQTKARKREETARKRAKRSAASRKGWETRRENLAAARSARLSDLEKRENAAFKASGNMLVPAVRGALIQASLYRKTGVAVLGNTADLMRDLKGNGLIELDPRDMFGGQTKGGQHVAGQHPEWDASDLEEYWTFDSARAIVAWAQANNKIPQLRAFAVAYGDITNPEAIMTREGRAGLLANAISNKQGNGPAPTVTVYSMPEVVQKSNILSMITRFVAEVYYEDKQKDAANMRRYKSLFGDKTISEAAREKTEQIAKFMRFTDNGTKFVKIDDYIDNAIATGKAALPTAEVKQDKAEIASLIPQIALKGRDTITDTRNGEIFVRIVEILGKYGYN